MGLPYSELEAANKVIGQCSGYIIVTDTLVHAGNFYALQALTSCVVTHIAETNATGSYDGLTLAGDSPIYGDFTSVQLASGAMKLFIAG